VHDIFIYRYILRESCSQFDSLPLTSLTIPGADDCRSLERSRVQRTARGSRCAAARAVAARSSTVHDRGVGGGGSIRDFFVRAPSRQR